MKIDFGLIQECVDTTFESKGDYESDNQLLKDSKRDWLSYGT